MNKKTMLMMSLALAASVVLAEEPKSDKQKGLTDAQIEARAERMVKNAVQLFSQNEDDRAVGMLEALPRMYPKAQACFLAKLELGRHFLDKRVFDRATKELRAAGMSKNGEVRAEALFLEGRVLNSQGKGGEAVMILRRLTQEFPTSLFANDAFFLIGQIHFDAKRWSRASEAFKMVGTAVPEEKADTNKAPQAVLAEAGQRIYAHVRDKDLAVMLSLGQSSKVVFVSASGDREEATLEPFGRGDGDFLANVRTTGEASKPNDGLLTVRGDEGVRVEYVDVNRENGDRLVNLGAKAEIVSSGSIALMDGAQRQRVRGVFVDQPTIVRLRDYDLDKTDQPDGASVTVKVMYRERPELPADAPEGTPPPPPAPDAPWLVRTQLELPLVETGGRTAVFIGKITPRLLPQPVGTNAVPVVTLPAGEVGVNADEKLLVEYSDVKHLEGGDPVVRSGEALVLVGGSTEPQSIVSHSSEASVQARKLLLEAQLLQKWGNIFKEVGLDATAKSKAEEGLQKIGEMMALASRSSLERSIVEEGYEARWNLYLVQGNLGAAIATCRELVTRYPDTLLADRAFLQIANARREERTPESLREAISVYNSIISLPQSQLKAEAQFRIGEVMEEMAKAGATAERKPDFSGALMAFKRCAETYPNSSFAGDSFKRMIDYYISVRNYSQSIEILERVFQDYPDAPWLDEMLLKWGVVLNRTGDREGAMEKFSRLLEEYPGGKAAGQAKTFMDKLRQRME